MGGAGLGACTGGDRLREAISAGQRRLPWFHLAYGLSQSWTQSLWRSHGREVGIGLGADTRCNPKLQALQIHSGFGAGNHQD